MLYLGLKAIHMLALVMWVGGMAFLHFVLRPALAPLAPPQRLPLVRDVLARFFKLVLLATAVVLASGAWMMGSVLAMIMGAGGGFNPPLDWVVMAVVGVLMLALFGYIRWRGYPRLAAAVDASDWSAAGAELEDMRFWVGVNLALGVALTLFVYLV